MLTPRELSFTNLQKVWFPEAGLTKGIVLDYYRRVAPRLLPLLRDRPVTLERTPDGVGPGKPHFWQKDTPAYYPQWLHRVELPTARGKPVHYVLVDDLPALLYLVNQGVVTFHVGFSRLQDLQHPDFVLFDLDRSEASFADVVAVARSLHLLLKRMKIATYVKTSGKSGLHVLAPWKEQGNFDAARAWAMQVAQQVVAMLPGQATVERSKAGRHQRVYIDVIQNAEGHHAVPPYVVRAIPRGTVSMPLRWAEVNEKLDPAQFSVAAALRRIARQKHDPLAELTADFASARPPAASSRNRAGRPRAT